MGCQTGLSATETLCRFMNLLSGNISGAAPDIIRVIIRKFLIKQRDIFFINIYIHTHTHIFLKYVATKGLQTKHCLSGRK